MKAESNLYERVAGRVARLIETGTYRPGERVPSVRALSRELDVSVSTTLLAYRILETRGLIAPRPQSGYYVRQSQRAPDREPKVIAAPPDPTAVTVHELVMMMVRDACDPKLLPLGAAAADPATLPLARLHRLYAKVARNDPARANSYDTAPGCSALRVQLAKRAVAAGCTLSPDDFITTCGAQEALNLSLRAVCRPGDTIAVESPIFYGILQAIEALSLRAVEIPVCCREGLGLDSLRTAIRRQKIRAVVCMPNFNNPLGTCMPEAKTRELVKMLAAREIPLIEDDTYGELPHNGERPRAAKAFDTKGLVLLCSSFSKTLSPGARVGWVVPGRFRAAVERLKTVTTLATPTIPQMGIAEFLADGGYERHLRSMRKLCATQTAWMRRAVLAAFPEGTKVSCPAGGFLLWVDLPQQLDALKLYRLALRAGITISPGVIFSPRQRFRNCFRLNAAHSSEAIERGIATLGQLARRL